MVNYFFDTSALIKRYRNKEIGSNIVNKIFNESYKIITITNLTIVETFQRFYRLYKETEINEFELNDLIDGFYTDINNHITIYNISTEHSFKAEEIIRETLHNRTIKKRPGAIDILQICAAMDFLYQDFKFVSSDTDLNLVAKIKGIPVLNPEKSNIYSI